MCRSRRQIIAMLAALLGASLSGCNSPTLPPLPPPSEPRVVQHLGNGEVLLEGRIPVPEAKLLVLNTATDEIRGVFTRDGRYSFPVPAQEGDFMHLWYSTEGLDSPLYRFTIPAPPEAPDGGDARAPQGTDAPDAGE